MLTEGVRGPQGPRSRQRQQTEATRAWGGVACVRSHCAPTRSRFCGADGSRERRAKAGGVCGEERRRRAREVREGKGRRLTERGEARLT